jgi:protein TonB
LKRGQNQKAKNVKQNLMILSLFLSFSSLFFVYFVSFVLKAVEAVAQSTGPSTPKRTLLRYRLCTHRWSKAMATRAAAQHVHPDWQRVTALCTTFLTHAAAALVLAIPLAMQAERATPTVVEAIVRSEPEPLPPPPPETQPLPHTKPLPRAVPRAAPVTPTVPVESVIQVPAPPVPIETTSIASTPVTAPVGDGGPVGETRQLDYDGALKLRYPAASLRQREQGRVLLNVLVDANGNVQRIEIARSSGHSNLDAAAREAVQRAHFKPVLRDGKAVQAWGVVPIEFRLDRA